MGIRFYLIIVFGLPLTYAYATFRQTVAGNSTFRGIFFCNLGTPKTVISKIVTTWQIETPYSSPCKYDHPNNVPIARRGRFPIRVAVQEPPRLRLAVYHQNPPPKSPEPRRGLLLWGPPPPAMRGKYSISHWRRQQKNNPYRGINKNCASRWHE